MGRVKQHWMEIQEQEQDRKFAALLGVTYEDLDELDFEIETDESKDGIIYNYRIEFSDDSPKHILEKISRLKDGCRVYLEPWELYEEFDYEDQFDAIVENKEFVKNYKDEIKNLENLASMKISDKGLKGVLNRQIFIGIIGTMETFLADVFINLTFDNEKYFRNFIETHPNFHKQKFELREIYDKNEKLKEIAKKVMLETIYHHLPAVSEMYKNTFKIEFPKINEVHKYVLQRHDLVHRNGKTKDGKIVITDEKSIDELIKTINTLVFELARKLKL